MSCETCTGCEICERSHGLAAQLAAEAKEHDEARRANEAHERTITGLRNSRAILAAQLAAVKAENQTAWNKAGEYELRANHAEAENARLRGENICDACAGEPISGKPCMCGGSGKMSDAAVYLRAKFIEADEENARLRADVAEGEYRLGLVVEDRNEARTLLERFMGENERLRAERDQAVAANRGLDADYGELLNSCNAFEDENARLRAALDDLKSGLHPDGSGRYDSYLVATKRLRECQAENARLRAAIAPTPDSKRAYVAAIQEALPADVDEPEDAINVVLTMLNAIAARAGVK